MNRWKVLALVMIGLLVIAVGIRFAYIEEHTFPLNNEQKTFAIKAAQNGLKDVMEGSDYNITVQEHGRIIPAPNGDKKIVRVIFTRRNQTLVALVDMDTGTLVEKSSIEYSDWMMEYQNQPHHPHNYLNRWIHYKR